MSITQWPRSERPRERLLARGTAALSDTELVSLLIREGVAGRTALEVARDALTRFGGVGGLLRRRPASCRRCEALGRRAAR